VIASGRNAERGADTVGVRHDTHYGIFDTFETDAAREALIAGGIPKALAQVADDLLAPAPDIAPIGVIAV
jgi:hypothetical protein